MTAVIFYVWFQSAMHMGHGPWAIQHQKHKKDRGHFCMFASEVLCVWAMAHGPSSTKSTKMTSVIFLCLIPKCHAYGRWPMGHPAPKTQKWPRWFFYVFFLSAVRMGHGPWAVQQWSDVSFLFVRLNLIDRIDWIWIARTELAMWHKRSFNISSKESELSITALYIVPVRQFFHRSGQLVVFANGAVVNIISSHHAIHAAALSHISPYGTRYGSNINLRTHRLRGQPV